MYCEEFTPENLINTRIPFDSHTTIENRIYREELKESLGMNFFSPFQPEKGVQSVQIM